MTPRFGYAETSFGQLHYAEQGRGPVVLCLHQTPRSWDEFRELMGELADDHRVIAMDMVGFGASAALAGPQTIEAYARGAWELLDALGVATATVLGHHTGAAVAVEMAAENSARLDAVVLSSCPWVDAAYRSGHSGAGGVDQAEHAEDGAHLQRLWDLRRPYYPAAPTDLLDRFLHDALSFGVDPAEGHRACSRYRMEDRIGAVATPVLLVGAGADPFAIPHLPTLKARLTAVPVIAELVIDDGTVALMERAAPRIAAAVRQFLSVHGRVGSGVAAVAAQT